MPGNRMESFLCGMDLPEGIIARGPARRQRAAATSARLVQVAVAAKACLTLSSTA